MINAGLHTSILGRAARAGLISVHTVNFRNYTHEKHGHVDDAPFGGGAGMVLMCQPIYDAWLSVCEEISARKTADEIKSVSQTAAQELSASVHENSPRVLYTSPAGRVFDQQMARELAREEDLIILCGHYEGVDQRVLELIGAEEVSIGDYILTGGELPAMVMVDAISRMVPGVLTNSSSGEEESFSEIYPEQELTRRVRKQVYGDLLTNRRKGHNKKRYGDGSDLLQEGNETDAGTKTRTEVIPKVQTDKPEQIKEEICLKLLEYPQYTRPVEFMGLHVPPVLLTGDHARILAWRREQSIRRTRERRPDLLSEFDS